MPCTGTYLGSCCEQIRDVIVTASASVRGFLPLDLVDRQQLYESSASTGRFSIFGTSGSYSTTAIMTAAGAVYTSRTTGSAPPYVYPLRRYEVQSAILISLTNHLDDTGIRCAGTTWASEEFRVSGPLRKSADLALEKVTSYDPLTGANPGGATVVFGVGALASMDGGTFAPSCGTYPSRLGLIGCENSVYGWGGTGEGRVTASVNRCVFAPRPGFLLRLRPYFRSECQTGPITYESCSTVNLEAGADVLVSELPVGKQIAGVELTIHSITGPSPC